MSHLDEGQLTALLDNELTAAERNAAQIHLTTCEECRRLFEEVKAFATEAEGLVGAIELPPGRPLAPPGTRSAPEPPDRRARWSPRWRTLAWAATVVLAVGLGWAAGDFRMDRRQPTFAEQSFDSTPATMAKESEPLFQREVAAPRTEAEDKIAPKDDRPRKRADEDAAPSRSQPAPAAAAPAPSAGALADAAELDRRANAGLAVGKAVPAPAEPVAPAVRALETVATGAVARQRTGGFRQVEMEEAVRALSGSIRLVDGLQPKRVLIGAGELVRGADPALDLVRVVYEDPPGRDMWLDQQRPREAEPGALGAYGYGMLAGDTVVTRGSAGSNSIRWIDQHGFQLALTGFLATDSLRAMIPRVH